MCLEIVYSIYGQKDLALNNHLQWLICYKTKPNLIQLILISCMVSS